MSNEEQVRQHKEVCNMLNEIYEQKNRAYGNSFGDTYKDLGIISAVTRINDKFNRLKTLAKNKEINQGDESIADTLLDMANYCIMTYMELQNEEATKCSNGSCPTDMELTQEEKREFEEFYMNSPVFVTVEDFKRYKKRKGEQK